MKKVFSLPLPEYTITTKPDDIGIGKKIDDYIDKHFHGKEVAIRAISLKDHPNFSRGELVDKILKLGTDKYDPNRLGVAHEEFAPYQADLQASPCKVGVDHFGEGLSTVRNFYENAPLDRGYSLRIDLLLIYDLSQLVKAEIVDISEPRVNPLFEKYLFRFKYPKKKQKALIGVVQLLG